MTKKSVTLKEVFLNEDVSFTQEEENDTLGECGMPPEEDMGMEPVDGLPPEHPPVYQGPAALGPEYVVVKVVDGTGGDYESGVGKFGAPGSVNFDNPPSIESGRDSNGMLYDNEMEEDMYGEGSCGGMHENMHDGERDVLMDEDMGPKTPMELAYGDYIGDDEEGDLEYDLDEIDPEEESMGVEDMEKVHDMEDEERFEGPPEKMSFWEMGATDLFGEDY